jgi:hypothetical protein
MTARGDDGEAGEVRGEDGDAARTEWRAVTA